MTTALLRSKSAPHALVDEPRLAGAKHHHHHYQYHHGGTVGRAQGQAAAGANRNTVQRARASMKAQLKLTRLEMDVDVTTTVPTLASDAGALGVVGAGRTPAAMASPLDAPREDPFNLAGFFPSRPGSPHTPTTAWASGELADAEARAAEAIREEDKDADEDAPLSRRALSLSALDEYAKSVIAEESAFGILRLARFGLPAWFARPAKVDEEDEKLELLADIEPYDDETLYAALHARRTAGLVMPTTTTAGGMSFGLFVPDV